MSEGTIAKRARERSRRERGSDREDSEREAIDREKMRRRCSLSNMFFVQGVSN